jgi:Fe-S cluster assembly ATPase SufC
MSTYITSEDATAYFKYQKLFADAWEAASSTQRTVSLQMATNLMETISYAGDKTDEEQELQFPRGGDVDIPSDIQYACAENAYALLDGVDPELEYDNLRTVSRGFSSVRSSQNTTILPEHKIAGIPSYIAWRLMTPYLRDRRALKVLRTS